jgi:transposase
MLYEAAFSLLVVCKAKSKLRTWGLKLVKKKGMKKAVVAVARKLAVIMHRMLVAKTAFCP